MSNVVDLVKTRLVKQYVTIYLTKGEFFAGMFITQSWPTDWQAEADEWHALIKKEFEARGYKLVYPEEMQA